MPNSLYISKLKRYFSCLFSHKYTIRNIHYNIYYFIFSANLRLEEVQKGRAGEIAKLQVIFDCFWKCNFPMTWSFRRSNKIFI